MKQRGKQKQTKNQFDTDAEASEIFLIRITDRLKLTQL
jgi:hypothetical protein